LRLIDGDKLYKQIREEYVNATGQSVGSQLQELSYAATATMVKESPTVNAVHVVRCDKCEHWTELWNHTHECELFQFRTPSNGFCNYGENINTMK